MEENTNTNSEATQAENMGNEAAQGQDGAKTFSQDEVNRIIQGRLDQMKKQAAKEQETELSQKAQELQAREIKLLVKEQLSERGMPRELADIITCTDEADIKGKLDALSKIYGSQSAANEKEKTMGFIQVGYASGNSHAMPVADPVRNAMGLN